MGWTASYLLIAAAGAYVGSQVGKGGHQPVIPPSPVIPAAQVDQAQQEAENNAKKRQQLSGGITSTIGTAGGQAGSMLDPGTFGGKTLLGQ